MFHRPLPLLLVFLASLALLGGCAESVKDVNRVQGNYVRKTDLVEGEWYMLTTVVGVPPTRAISFAGETGKMERVRFEFREDELVAYRAYPLLPGADTPSTHAEFDGKDAPLAAWPVESHFDIRRDYNPATGEQSNVLDENSSDRKWFEREFARVDWSVSDLRNFDFVLNLTWEEDFEWTGMVNTQYASFISEEEGGEEALHRETDADGRTTYFDVLGKLIVEPNFYYCVMSWWGYGAYDCGPAEITERTSFLRVPEKKTYEPFHYDDHLMSRFGYFRSERFTYDEQRGVVDSGREYLIQRHNIWETAYDEAGEVIPIPQRKTRTVPYYLSPTFPEDDRLDDAAIETMKQWDNAARRAVAVAQGKKVDDIGNVFTLCHNPVIEADHDACGQVGFAPRMGDLRYSVLHWVDSETMEGLLGYGPSAADPLTGEIIAGKAHVYGAAVNTYATYAVDVIRFFNEDLDADQLIYGKQFAEAQRERVARVGLPSAGRSPKLDRVPLDRRFAKHHRRDPDRADRRELRPYDPRRTQQRLADAQARGATPMRMNDEVRRALEHTLGTDWASADSAARELLDPTSFLSNETLKARRRHLGRLRAHNVEMTDLIEPNIQGIVRYYEGRTDYDEIWRELRAQIFASTAEHEVGHTLGLRHNFQGSYDSLNYFDKYWKLRQETLPDGPITTLGELYDASTLTEAQHEGQMRQKQYSSIMDYGLSWANDLAGLGKYDDAAILFGYTAGSYEASGERCKQYPSVAQGSKCVARLPGFVDVFKKSREALGEAGRILTRTEYGHSYDDPGLPSVTALERFHYTTLARAFPSLEDFGPSGRTTMSYADYLDEKAAAGPGDDRTVRVPFMFCSDEWESGLLSCRVFDQGADPFELTKTIIDDYRAYYYFVNFRRDRVEFDEWAPLFRYWDYTFLPLSDIYQFWYLSPSWDPTVEFDPLFNSYYDVAVYAGFNLFGEALSTPPYGTYCEGQAGRLIFLTDSQQEVATRQQDEPACVDGSALYQVAPGVGRRRFSRYDNHAGYFLEWKPLEAGHYWTELAAVLSIVDPDATVIGAEGDAGTYAISYYDLFGEEMEGLLNAIVSEDYTAFAPRARLRAKADEQPAGTPVPLELEFRPPAPFYDYLYDSRTYYHPETGAAVGADDDAEIVGGAAGLCDECATDTDCAGHTGEIGGVYCVGFAGQQRCIVDCTAGQEACPEGTQCFGGNCIPDGRRTCEDYQGECSESRPLGRCPAGQTCVEGACTEGRWSPVVETDASFMLDTDIFWYGFIYTTAGFSTRFNDNLNVFRPGTQDEVVSDPALSERVSFTDPFRGITYAAVQPRCDIDNALTNETPHCGACLSDMQCEGFDGTANGTMCFPVDGAGKPGACLKRCTRGQDECPAGTLCNDQQVCEPANGCPVAAARCALLDPPDTGAVKLVKRGKFLAEDHDRKMRAYWADPGDAPDSDRISTEYWRAKYALENHLDLLETLRATFEIFGGVF